MSRDFWGVAVDLWSAILQSRWSVSLPDIGFPYFSLLIKTYLNGELM